MTVATLASFAAILPLRYGTPQEKDILFDDVCFLKTALVERTEMDVGSLTRSISHAQITNISSATRASCAYFLDGSRLEDMDFGVAGAWKSQVYSSFPSPVPWPSDPLTNVFGFAMMTSTVPAEIGREIAIGPMLRIFRDVREMRYKAQIVTAESGDAWMEYVSSTDGTLTNSTGIGGIYVREKKASLEEKWDDVLKTNYYEMVGVDEYNVTATAGNLKFVVPNATRCLVLAGYWAYHETEDALNRYLDGETTTGEWAFAVVPFLVTASDGFAHIPQEAYSAGTSILSAFGFPTSPRSPSVTALSESVDVTLDWVRVVLLDVSWPTTDISGWDWNPGDGN